MPWLVKFVSVETRGLQDHLTAELSGQNQAAQQPMSTEEPEKVKFD